MDFLKEGGLVSHSSLLDGTKKFNKKEKGQTLAMSTISGRILYSGGVRLVEDSGRAFCTDQ